MAVQLQALQARLCCHDKGLQSNVHCPASSAEPASKQIRPPAARWPACGRNGNVVRRQLAHILWVHQRRVAQVVRLEQAWVQGSKVQYEHRFLQDQCQSSWRRGRLAAATLTWYRRAVRSLMGCIR